MHSGTKFLKMALLPLALVLAMLVAACGASGPTNQSAQQGKAPASKQILVWPIEGVSDVATLDPALIEDVYSGQAAGMIFNGLMQYNDKADIVPDLATSYDVSPDGLTWTFHLRTGVKFSDGTPVTSADVAFSFDRALQPSTKSAFASSILGPIKDSDKLLAGKIKTVIGDSLLTPDPQTIKIIAGKKAAYFLDNLAGSSVANVIEKSFVQKYGSSFTSQLTSGGGAGPWVISKYVHNQYISFVPNPNYFGPKPALAKVVMPFYKQSDTSFRGYQANQVDLATVPTAQLSSAKALGNGQFRQDPSLVNEWFTMNYLVKPFDNIKVRQAFALAIDKDQIAQFIYKGTVIPTNHIIPQGVRGYNPNLTGPDGVKSTAGDPTLARQLFDQGLAEDGLTRATLPPIVFSVSTAGNQDLKNTYQAAQQMWQNALGISVKINDLDFNKLVTDITGTVGNGNVMALSVGWSGTPDPYDWTSFHFGATSQLDLSNFGKNPALPEQKQIQQLLAQGDAEVGNLTLRLQEYDQAEQQLVNEVSWIPLYQGTRVYVVKPCVAGWPHNPFYSAVPQPDWANIYLTTATPCADTAIYQ